MEPRNHVSNQLPEKTGGQLAHGHRWRTQNHCNCSMLPPPESEEGRRGGDLGAEEGTRSLLPGTQAQGFACERQTQPRSPEPCLGHAGACRRRAWGARGELAGGLSRGRKLIAMS